MINALIQTAYPQALAKLIVQLKDINTAEDALQSAVEQALLSWPSRQPENTVAWLVRVGQNKYIDDYRKNRKHCSIEHIPELVELPDLSEQALLMSYNDDLLRLIFTCCHPALAPETQITLALKHVLGLNLTEIANALVIKNKTLEQRLTRAKKKINANNIQYEIPTKERWPERLAGVMKTIYLLFNEGYLATEGKKLIKESLCKEAIRLSRLLHLCIRNNAEVIGLLALLLQQDARSPARIDNEGNIILLPAQNRTLWKKRNIQEANILTHKALKLGGAKPYALQAAIASLHNNARSETQTDWHQIYQLYQLLIKQSPTAVIKLNAAIVLAKTGSQSEAITDILNLENELKNYRHYHTTLAALYVDNKQQQQALIHYKKAEKQTKNQRELNFIQQQIAQCLNSIRIQSAADS